MSEDKSSGEFEKQLKRLEEIVEKMESEDIGIEKSLELFQEGMKLGKACRKTLSDIELKVNRVLGEDDDGQVATGPSIETDEF